LLWFGSGLLWLLQFGSRVLQLFKVASVWFGLVQDSFSLVQFKVASAVQGCSSLVQFGSRFLQFGSRLL
jgi:hypothetical protein